MIPGVDPRAMKAMMAKMGIRSVDIDASRVTIECGDSDIIISEPQVTRIEMQGVTSFQITGNISEQQKEMKVEVSEDDIKVVQEQTGITDAERVKSALVASGGDIAKAILDLKEGG